MQLNTFRGVDGFIDFAHHIGLSSEETTVRLASLKESHMPFMVTRFYADVIRSSSGEWRTQLLNIVVPTPGAKPFRGRFDPYGNVRYRQNDDYFLQHKYAPTLLIHMYDYCISNCQFCYKVNEIRHEKKELVSFDDKIAKALRYLDLNPVVNNILFTGGDPAAMPVEYLIECIKQLLEHKNIRIVRFATKVLAYNPTYFLNDTLLRFLAGANSTAGKQVTIIAQINHPAELTDVSKDASRALQNSGCQIRGQPTIAKGINDDAEVLATLHRTYIDNRIIPYYFTVFMPVRGVEQYAIPLHDAYRLMSQASLLLNGLEKKSVLLASHDFGKFEICGFLPDLKIPDKVILRWHERPMEGFLPKSLSKRYTIQENNMFLLDYIPDAIYCIDHLFCANGLPHFDSDNGLIDFHGN